MNKFVEPDEFPAEAQQLFWWLVRRPFCRLGFPSTAMNIIFGSSHTSPTKHVWDEVLPALPTSVTRNAVVYTKMLDDGGEWVKDLHGSLAPYASKKRE
ncbi:hypothetical protein KEM54_000036 [Ascosphaera aggregata]|nr:hypothetical protein KEM54_000036 [Ascosphaera aggregata]